MNLKPAFLAMRLAWLSLWRMPELNLLRLFSFVLALLGPYLVLSLQAKFESTLKSRGREQLGADLIASFETVPDDKTLAQVMSIMPPNSSYKWGVNLVSMAEHNGKSHLVELLALDEGLPFYPSAHFEKQGIHFSTNKQVWIDEEGRNLFFQAEPNSNNWRLFLGNGEISLKAGELPPQYLQFRFGGLGPRIIMNKKHVEELGLTGFGAQVLHLMFVQFPFAQRENTISNKRLDDMRNTIAKDGQDSVRFLQKDRPLGRAQRALERTISYLGLVALLSFFLGMVGTLYLTWSYWIRAQSELALFKAISPRAPNQLVLWQIFYLATIAMVIVAMLASSAIFLAREWFGPELWQRIPIQFDAVPSWKALSGIFILGNLVPALACLPILRMINQLSLATLLEDQSPDNRPDRFHWSYLLSPLVLFFGCYFFTQSWLAAGLFLSIIVGLLVIGLPLSIALIKFLASFASKLRIHLAIQLGLRSMSRRPLLSGMMILAMALSFGVFHAIIQLQTAIEKELLGEKSTQEKKSASFFLMDLPESSRPMLEKIISDNQGDILDLSHHVRGRLQTIDGKTSWWQKIFGEQSQETKDRENLKRHQLGFTFRKHLVADEYILEGTPLSELPHGEIGASVEKRYARRMGIKLGDKLEVDIFGTIIAAKVKNFRQVKWLNFRPNFFIVLSPEALGKLPYTYLAALHLPKEEGRQQAFLGSLRKKIPGVSAIDIERALNQVKSIMGMISLLLKACAILLPTGACLLLLGLAVYQRGERKLDQDVYSLLGMDNSSLKKITLSEFAVIGPISTVFAYLLGSGIVMAILLYMVDLPLGAWSWSTVLSMIIPYTLGLGFLL